MTDFSERADSRPVLCVRGLKAGWSNKAVLHGVDLDVMQGEIRAILGCSGSGKSTLLRNVLGLETPWEGEIRVLGVDLARNDEEARSIRRRMGVLFQGGALLTSLTVIENVELPMILRGGLPQTLRREVARMRLAQVGLQHAADLLPGELSGGMRKRAALARALVVEPAVLFCDEPSAGLDPVSARALDDLLLALRDELGFAVVLVTHELQSLLALADRILYLHQGQVLFDGPIPAPGHPQTPAPLRDFLERRAQGFEREEAPLSIEFVS